MVGAGDIPVLLGGAEMWKKLSSKYTTAHNYERSDKSKKGKGKGKRTKNTNAAIPNKKRKGKDGSNARKSGDDSDEGLASAKREHIISSLFPLLEKHGLNENVQKRLFFFLLQVNS